MFEYEKVNRKTNKTIKFTTGRCVNCGRNKSQVITKQMTREEDLMRKGKCKNNHISALSNSARCDLNIKGDLLKLHDLGHNPKL